jgi:hypothetical protein
MADLFACGWFLLVGGRVCAAFDAEQKAVLRSLVLLRRAGAAVRMLSCPSA